MKKKRCILALGLALTMALGTAAAAGDMLEISVSTSTKVLVNGEQFVPRDANGKEVPIFNYGGTTYVPIRAVSDAFGLEVGYDADKQAAVITMPEPEEPEKVTPPIREDVDYHIASGPWQYTDEAGNPQTSYDGFEDDFHYWLREEDQDKKYTLEVIEGKLPDGLEQDGNVVRGQFLKPGTWDVQLRLTPEKGEAVERDLRFFVYDGNASQLEGLIAPVVITGRVGDDIGERYIVRYSDGVLYTGDDLTDDAYGSMTEFFEVTPVPTIGSQEGLDQLAEYGLSLTNRAQIDEEEDWVWTDNFVVGAFTKGTDGWIKISVPVFVGRSRALSSYEEAGLDPVEENGGLTPFGWIMNVDDNEVCSIHHETLDIYLNIISFD